MTAMIWVDVGSGVAEKTVTFEGQPPGDLKSSAVGGGETSSAPPLVVTPHELPEALLRVLL